jgi:hypothetical protein
MANWIDTEGDSRDFHTVGFDAVGYCLESWLRPREQDPMRPVPPDVRQAIAKDAARRVKDTLASLDQADHLSAGCTVVEGMLYMFMDLFEGFHDPSRDARASVFPTYRGPDLPSIPGPFRS